MKYLLAALIWALLSACAPASRYEAAQEAWATMSNVQAGQRFPHLYAMAAEAMLRGSEAQSAGDPRRADGYYRAVIDIAEAVVWRLGSERDPSPTPSP